MSRDNHGAKLTTPCARHTVRFVKPVAQLCKFCASGLIPSPLVGEGAGAVLTEPADEGDGAAKLRWAIANLAQQPQPTRCFTLYVYRCRSTEALSRFDRGFDAQDRQVWGATAGGYVFDRLQGAPSASDAGKEE